MMARVFERSSEWVNGDAALVRRGRYISTTFLIEVGEVAWLTTVHEGRVSRVERGPFLMRDWASAVRASEDFRALAFDMPWHGERFEPRWPHSADPS
jgi:hypothetical protein